MIVSQAKNYLKLGFAGMVDQLFIMPKSDQVFDPKAVWDMAWPEIEAALVRAIHATGSKQPPAEETKMTNATSNIHGVSLRGGLMRFATAFAGLGNAVGEQVYDIIAGRYGEINSNAARLIHDRLGGMNQELDDAIASYEAQNAKAR